MKSDPVGLVIDLIVLVLVVNVVGWLAMTVVGLWNRHKPGGVYFAVHMFLLSIITALTIVEFVTVRPDVLRFTAYVMMSLASATTASWFLFVVGYLGYNDRFPRFARLSIIVGSLVIPTVLVLLPDFYVVSIGIETTLGTPVAEPSFDAVGILLLTAMLFFVPAGLLLIARSALVTDELYGTQAAILVVAILVPWVGGIVAVAQVLPAGTPVARLLGVVTTALYAYLFWRDEGFSVFPATRRSGVRQAVSNLDDGLVIVEQGRVLLSNDAACSYLDCPGPPSEQQGRAVESLVDGTFLDDYVDGEFDTVPETIEYDERVYDVTKSTVGQTGYTLLIRDATMRREQRELRRQNERLDQFASVVSHDLRNPLGIAETYLDFAEDTGDTEDFEAVREAHQRMETMITDLLTMARTDSVVDDPLEVALADLTADTWETTQTADATLSVSVPTDATVQGDPDLLRNLFENLFRNCVAHNDPPVEVRVGLLDGTSGFFIADDGTGIPVEEREDVFDHGYTTSEDGTGFGLAIVTDIVEAHNWSISVTTSRDDGARFEVKIGQQEP